MNPLVELITSWDAYTATHENATVEAFCHHYLDSPTAPAKAAKNAEPAKAPRIADASPPAFDLGRLIGRIAAIQRTCLRLALRDMPGIEPEWYYFLHSIDSSKEIRKTDVISFSLLLEPTTGIDILNRMIRAGLLDEHEDLLRLTKKGRITLAKAELQVKAITDLLLGSLTDSQSQQMIQTLKKVEHRFGPLLAEHRPKTIAQLLALLG
jgi:hypothetical protein